MTETELYGKLTPEQKEAAFTEKGYIRVIASAGSGKTRVLSTRFVWLNKELSVPVQNIACITFTNKAAREMKDRIKGFLGNINTKFICTFHSLGYRILREDINKIGWPLKRFSIWDDTDIENILERIYEENDINTRLVTHKEARDYIHDMKQKEHGSYVSLLQWNSSEILNERIERARNAHEKIFLLYLKKQKDTFGLDFEDLIRLPLFIFSMNPEVKDKWATRFHYIMVDEYQDVSDVNYEFCEALASVHHNLFVVGDPDQLIYSWRQAKMCYLLQFVDTHEDTKTFELNTNFRSVPKILDAANSLIEHNSDRYPKAMEPCADKKDIETKIHCMHCSDRLQEAQYVANEVVRLGGTYHFNDMAVLYREHDIAKRFEETFLENHIPYRTYGHIPFYQTNEIKDLLSYLYLIEREDDNAFYRAIQSPKRGIGKAKLKTISSNISEDHHTMLSSLRDCLENGLLKDAKAAQFLSVIDTAREMLDGSLQELISYVLSESGLEEHYQTIGDQKRLDNLAELISSIRQYEDSEPEKLTLTAYLDEIATYTGEDSDEEDSDDKVQLMTVHAAKGLERKVVFVVAMNEDIFPSNHADNANKFEEERRLAYVAYTRAEEQLYISESELYAQPKDEEKQAYTLLPSRFIIEAGYDEMDHIGNELSEEVKKIVADLGNNGLHAKNQSEYKAGDEVHHSTFGNGIVESVESEGAITVLFFESGESRPIEVNEKLQHL